MKRTEIKKFIRDNSMIFPSEAENMYDALIKLPQAGRMLEIGTGFGHSTVFFAKTKPKWTIYTIDMYGLVGELPNLYTNPEHKIEGKNIMDVLRYFDNFEARNIIPIVQDVNKLEWELPLDALFIDGDHSAPCVKYDFETFYPFIKKGGLVIFHDYLYFGVKEFLDTLDLKYTVKANVVFLWKKE